MNKTLTVAIIGCGGRGCRAYGHLMHEKFSDQYKIVSLCDIQADVLNLQSQKLDVPRENCFLNETDFFAEKRADLLVIATQDRDHFRMTIKALALGYDILVEKPLTIDREECRMLSEAQKTYGGKVAVGHVLRYAPAFNKVYELLRAGSIGRLIALDVLEQVWYGHYMHSFVRGSWRRSDETSPMIIAKCCHDLDLIHYYVDSNCLSVSSVGDLTWFKAENAPSGSTERCVDCPHMETCPYSAKRLYIDRWLRNNKDYSFSRIITYPKAQTEEEIWKALRTGPYGRCVYHCDNNVVDHQMVNMTFENGVTASLTMMAFTGNGGRIVRLHGSLGELIIDEDEGYVKLKTFAEPDQEWRIDDLVANSASGHGGGDYMIISDLYQTITGGGEARSSLEASIESHLMGIAAEESRLLGGQLVQVHQ